MEKKLENISSNNGINFDIDWVMQSVVNDWSIYKLEEGIVDIAKGMKDTDQKVAFLLSAVSYIDLTTLGGDDSFGNVSRLCIKAQAPVLHSMLKDLKLSPNDVTTAAVCVYPARVFDAITALSSRKPSLPVAAVATGFPSGQYPLETRLAEIRWTVEQGAQEIDVVIDRSIVIRGEWETLYNELKEMKKACGTAHMKTILAVGELPSLTAVYRASLVAMMAGSDFIKTSTGKEAVNATIPTGLVMARAIREFHRRTGVKVGLKAAGGLRTAQDAITWMVLVRQELGREWLDKQLFRIGASSLLGSIEKEIYTLVYGVDPKPGLFIMS